MVASPSRFMAAAAICFFLAPLESAAEEVPSETSRRLNPSIYPSGRIACGLGIYPAYSEDNVEFDLDLIGGIRVAFPPMRASFALLPEVGYAFVDGEEERGHYGLIGLGLGVSFEEAFTLSTITYLMLGERSEEFDVGVRAGLRFEAFFLGADVVYEYRTNDVEDMHANQITLSLNFGLVIFFLANFERHLEPMPPPQPVPEEA